MIKLFSDSDLDGVSCAIIMSHVYDTNKIDTSFCNPKNIDSKIIEFIETGEYKAYKKIFITDLAIKESTAKLIDSLDSFRFKLFDHHRSSLSNSKYSWAVVRESLHGRLTCGTELLWNHLRDHLQMYIDTDNTVIQYIDDYVEYVRLWDTWDWINEGSKGIYAKNLNTVFHIYSKTKFMNSMIKRINTNSDFITNIEETLIGIEEVRKTRYIEQKMKNVRTIKIGNLNIGYVFAEMHISELGNYMVKNVPNIDAAAMINVDTNVVSLRSRKDSKVDLSKLARSLSYSGGGHSSSAGFVFDSVHSDHLIRKIFKLK